MLVLFPLPIQSNNTQLPPEVQLEHTQIETLSGYTLTVNTSVLIAEKNQAGNFKSGYETPAMEYGDELTTEISRTKRLDITLV